MLCHVSCNIPPGIDPQSQPASTTSIYIRIQKYSATSALGCKCSVSTLAVVPPPNESHMASHMPSEQYNTI